MFREIDVFERRVQGAIGSKAPVGRKLLNKEGFLGGGQGRIDESDREKEKRYVPFG